MKISPRELREAQIPSKAFGFNQDIVDSLLERAADTIEGLIEENRQLFEALERLRSEGSNAETSDPFAEMKVEEVAQEEATAEQPAVEPEPVVAAATVTDEQALSELNEKEELINKTLLLAQRTADETLKTAKSQADELIADAEKQATEMVEQATAAAQNLTGNAKEEAEANIAKAKEEAEQLVASAQQEAESLVSVAQEQADSIHAEERERFIALVEQLRVEREQLISDISLLQGFDQEHRTKLRNAVEEDLKKLEARETIDVDSLPELPVIENIAPIKPSSSKKKPVKEEKEAAKSFDELIEEPHEAELVEGHIDDSVIEDDYEADEIVEVPAAGDNVTYDTSDPFAAFVESDVVAPASDEDEAGVDTGKASGVKSSASQPAFDPGASSKKGKNAELDDDDFFASLREAVQDDAPLGPDDDEEGNQGHFKGLFKK